MTRLRLFWLTRLHPGILVGGAMSIMLALAGLLALELQHSHDRAMDYAASVTMSFARSLELQLLTSIDQINLVEQEAAFHYAASQSGLNLPAAAMNAMLARHRDRVPGLLSLRLVNAQGQYVFDASGIISPASIADRQYFRIHQDHPDQGLFAEGPLFSRVASLWTMTFSRGVRGADGRFLGIVQASMQTDVLSAAFASVPMGEGDIVTLLNGEGGMVARLPNLPDLIGKPAISPTLRALVLSGQREATYSGPSAADGRLRLYALHRIGDYPFYVVVGIPHDRILAEWHRTAWIFGGLGAALVLGLLLLSVRIFSRLSASVRRAEEQLRLTAEVFASALEGILIFDKSGRILSANHAICAMSGYRLDELLGQNVALFRSGRPEDSISTDLWADLQNKGRWQGELWNRRKSGALFPCRVSVSRFSTDAGDNVRYVSVYADIAEQKAAEQKLRFNNEELRRLAEITAHHLQEPTRQLITFSQKLKAVIDRQPLDDDSAATLALIMTAAGRLRALIHDVQRYLSADQPMGPQARHSLAEVMTSQLQRHADHLRQISAEIVTDPMLPAVEIDRPRLEALFDHLIDNAIRYRHPDRRLRLHLSATACGGRIRIRFADNGPGIPEALRPRLFRVFERLEHDPDGLHTGIGLAIIRRIVEDSGGQVWIEEAASGGTVVVFDLPPGEPEHVIALPEPLV